MVSWWVLVHSGPFEVVGRLQSSSNPQFGNSKASYLSNEQQQQPTFWPGNFWNVTSYLTWLL
jgi:hypothetical protein